jgi:hypothetical protein
VFASSVAADPSGLEGRYGGVSAEATVGIGLGAHVLLGGLDKSFALQPVSATGQTGIGAAVGIEGLRLKYIK